MSYQLMGVKSKINRNRHPFLVPTVSVVMMADDEANFPERAANGKADSVILGDSQMRIAVGSVERLGQ